MYIKNGTVYADAWKYLVCNGSFCQSFDESEIDNIEEYDIDFGGFEVRWIGEMGFAICPHCNISYVVPAEKTVEAMKKWIIDNRYNDEERINIIVNKDMSDESAFDYKKLVEWSEYAEGVAKKIGRLIGIDTHETIDTIKADVIKKINDYDSSDNVNLFYFNDMPMWLDKATRVGLMNSTTILIEEGEEATTLWFGNHSFTVPCETVIAILHAVERYALECFNVTAEHKANVLALETIDDVLDYDYTIGYPEKLVFNDGVKYDTVDYPEKVAING
jgi:hypothetical protein